MKAPPSNLLWATALFLPTIAAQTQQYFTNEVNERAVSCPEDPNQIGYKHVTDVIADQKTEQTRVATGEVPRKPYIFPFCNNFKYLMEQEILEVILDDITFVCGYNGLNEELCVFEGGALQVLVPEGSAAKNIVFQGMSFFGFTEISTKAYGAGSSKITFNDAAWKDFSNGAVAVHQMLPAGGVPMEVEVNRAVFQSGIGSNLFDNVGGILNFDKMTIIESVRADSMIRTSAAGTSRLANVDVTMSDLTRLTHTLGGSTQTVNGVRAYVMNSLGSLLFVEGGSTLTAMNVQVMENKLMEAYKAETSRNFNVLIATDSSTATLSTVTVSDNDGVDRIFSANGGSTVSVTDATVTNNIGTQPPDLLSNIAMSEDGGSMNVLRLSATNSEAFSSAFFAICGSSLQVKQSCVTGGKFASPVFVSSDSTLITDGNYIDSTSLTLARCFEDPTLLVFSETSDESKCFSDTGTGACNGQCVAGFTESDACLAGNGEAGYSLVANPAPGANQNNLSCPASPPSVMPTLPPGFLEGGGADGEQGGPDSGENPGFTDTLPPDQQGGGGGGGSSNGDGFGGGGGSGGGGGNGGSGASALMMQQWPPILLQVGSALVVAKFVHRLMF